MTILQRVALLTACALGFPGAVRAQWVQQHEQFYLQAPHNWQFRDRYQSADRLFNAFDYGHAILYEILWTRPGSSPALLETEEYDFLTKRLLVRPPRVPVEEGAIEVHYARLVPEAKLMFEWAHVLHRQLYDVLADERLSETQKDGEVARLLAYYRTRPDLAFSTRPKSMRLMQEQPYSLAFRQRYPKFNALIWAYHWLQVGLYEPLLVGRTSEERQALVRATVARFWQMLERPVAGMPHQMPMTPAVAPEFARRYPEAAIIFDNLHSMHDVISDILANPQVPRGRKRAEILIAAARFRDDTSYVMTEVAWRTMAQHMGVENMGGLAVGFLPALPTPTVTYGAVMQHDDRTGAMTGFAYGNATGGEHAGHGTATPVATPVDSTHAHHGAPANRPTTVPTDSLRTELHRRLLADPVIRERVRADSVMRRLLAPELHAHDSVHVEPIPVRKSPPPAAARPRSGSTTKPRAARATKPLQANRPATRAATPKPPPKPAPKPADPHAGHKMPPGGHP